MKTLVENKSRLTAGKSVICENPQTDERQLSLSFNLTAKDEEQFFDRYLGFCDELKKGMLNIKTRYQPSVTYKVVYLSCSQFTQFMRNMASFSLKLNEPNPTDRTE